ncbi:MAG TPA: MBL fold metallo-hydrolase [Polyangiales bacterium]|jgi:L-ascorbate metabolism protein UlaG (beta-lactamase superfamily)
MKPIDRPISASLRAQFAPYFASPRGEGQFRNPWPSPALPSLRDVLRWKTARNPLRERGMRQLPRAPIPNALADFEALSGETRLFWIGHASFLLELDRVRFVIDPIFGRAGGLVPRVTPASIGPADLTNLAAVLVTHGHHDHLDPNALREIAAANGGKTLFVVPLALSAALPRECEPRLELDWWQFIEIAGVRVNLVPAQHWHRRGLFDENKALWGGYVIEGSHRVYHSGDTGYFGGFRAIGAAFEGIDAACLPLGAYEPRWFMSAQHMSPEQSLDAMQDLAASHMIGMHWGTYDLSDEPLDAGPAILRREAALRAIEPSSLHVLEPGGSLSLRGARGRTSAQVCHALSAAPR